MAVKNPQQLERHLKGVANHWRIKILMLVARKPGMSMEEISETLDCHFKTVSAHTQRLVQAGLLEKKYLNRSVLHSLSPYGKRICDFLKSF